VLRAQLAEALAGLVVILVAGVFLAHAWTSTGQGGGDRYALLARFPNATGVTVGTDVRISGMKVGQVTAQQLDPGTFEAVLTLSVDRAVRLPADTSAAISSEGLLGGSFVALLPGGETEMLKPGDEILDTQGATDLMGLVGSFINRSAGAAGGEAAGRETGGGPAGGGPAGGGPAGGE
jgi:phospholipid/cholesterol/gamma-HCH transport system substrate-binding protein